MKCSVAKKTLLRWADGQLLNVEEREVVNGHLTRCESCRQWREYMRVIEEGPKDVKIPPFKMSSRVEQAIREAHVQESKPRAWPSLSPLFRPRMAVALAAIIAVFIGIYALVLNNPPKKGSLEWMESEGISYQVVRFDPSASLDPDHLKLPVAPALQGRASRQIAFLTAPLASALNEVSNTFDREKVRRSLEAQEVDISSEPLKFLVISKHLTDILQTDVRNIELWVIQPAPSVMLFTIAGDEGE